MQEARVRWAYAAAACLVLLLGAPLQAADETGTRLVAEKPDGGAKPAAACVSPTKNTFSDGAVRAGSTFALSILPGRADPNKYLIPIEDARCVLHAATRSAYAEACNLPDLEMTNYLALMREELGRKTWSQEQLWFIDALHRFTVAYLGGNIPIIQEGQTTQPIAPKKLTCSPELRAKVTQMINDYVQSVKATAGPVGPGFAAEDVFLSQGTALNAQLKKAYEQANYEEAENLARKRIEIADASSKNSADYADALSDLAKVYRAEGQYENAILLFQRALPIHESVVKSAAPGAHDLELPVADILTNLADLYVAQDRSSEAMPLYEHALAIFNKGNNNFDPRLTTSLTNLAKLYDLQGRYADAITLCEQALMHSSAGLSGPTDTDPRMDEAQVRNALAGAYLGQRRYAEAVQQHERELALYEKGLGPEHPNLAKTLDDLANVYLAEGKYSDALQNFRRAATILVKRATTDRRHESEGGAAFFGIVSAAFDVASEAPADRQALAEETFEAAQRATHSAAGAALAQMAARFAAGDTALAGTVRDQQDLAVLRAALDKELVVLLSDPPDRRDPGIEDRLKRQRQEIEQRLTAIGSQLQKDFPSFAGLGNPAPLTIAQTQGLLRPDEAMVTYLLTDHALFIWAVTKDGIDWQREDLGSAELAEKVEKLRAALDIAKVQRALAQGQEPKTMLFDAGAAYALYSQLLAPIDSTIKDKKSLLIVPSGPLTSLPFHLLVTSMPERPASGPSDYRQVAWMAKRQAITVVPSVFSLEALRVLAKSSGTPNALSGYGDPVFQRASPQEGGKRSKVADAAPTRSYTDYFRGVGTDLDALRRGLPALPETADELHAVARRLGVPNSDIHLGEAATETAVKSATLDDYRVIYFATHGLVAGDVKGLGEPALALTLPATATEQDDGLLTASEVAQLRLNADWVVLSACNTAAGDKPGAEALSGLARAFFYAGARALLVSHWPVGSEAAVRLTTATFDTLKANPAIGRSEALRRAMVAMIDDTSNEWNAYPAFWAPFVVVGDGGPIDQ